MKENEKRDLLEEIEDIGTSTLEVKDLVFTFLLIAIIFALIVPKIYLSNEIYYKSRSINKLLDNYEILKEEHRLLKQKLEYVQFKNKVLDEIF